MPYLTVPSFIPKPSAGKSMFGRVKVSLPPGKGLMDWIRLASARTLAKKRMSVDHTELMRHNKREDCWVLISGQVYDVTSYLEFHPGGIPELMRAAGTDATELFNQIHAWINYENMLKSCYVGPFTGDICKLPQPGPTTLEESQSISEQLNALIVDGQQSIQTHGITVIKGRKTLTVSSASWNSSNLRLPNVVVDVCLSNKLIRIVIRLIERSIYEVKWDNVYFDSSSLCYEVRVQDGSVIVTFEVLNAELALASAVQSIRRSTVVFYHECVVEEKHPISHDTLLFVLRLPEGLFFPIALGSHVVFRIRKEASFLCRPYTPIDGGSLANRLDGRECTLCSESAKLTFIIKIYKEGHFTPSLEKLEIGDAIEISDPIGNTDFNPWTDINCGLLMLAAGTGLTPMINVVRERLRRMVKEGRDSCNTQLLLFNKTEEDIISDDCLPMRWSDQRISIQHILSNPSKEWSGLKGRIEASMLPKNQELRVMICGPDGFNATTQSLLLNAGYKTENIHTFQGHSDCHY